MANRPVAIASIKSQREVKFSGLHLPSPRNFGFLNHRTPLSVHIFYLINSSDSFSSSQVFQIGFVSEVFWIQPEPFGLFMRYITQF